MNEGNVLWELLSPEQEKELETRLKTLKMAFEKIAELREREGTFYHHEVRDSSDFSTSTRQVMLEITGFFHYLMDLAIEIALPILTAGLEGEMPDIHAEDAWVVAHELLHPDPTEDQMYEYLVRMAVVLLKATEPKAP